MLLLDKFNRVSITAQSIDRNVSKLARILGEGVCHNDDGRPNVSKACAAGQRRITAGTAHLRPPQSVVRQEYFMH